MRKCTLTHLTRRKEEYRTQLQRQGKIIKDSMIKDVNSFGWSDQFHNLEPVGDRYYCIRCLNLSMDQQSEDLTLVSHTLDIGKQYR